MDIADIASDRELLDTANAIKAARQAAPAGPKPCGSCHNCLEPVAEGRVFCDADCREDYEFRKKQERLR